MRRLRKLLLLHFPSLSSVSSSSSSSPCSSPRSSPSPSPSHPASHHHHHLLPRLRPPPPLQKKPKSSGSPDHRHDTRCRDASGDDGGGVISYFKVYNDQGGNAASTTPLPSSSSHHVAIAPGIGSNSLGRLPKRRSVPVLVGKEARPYAVKARYLNHPLFIELLDKSAADAARYSGSNNAATSFPPPGTLVIDCEPPVFEHALTLIAGGCDYLEAPPAHYRDSTWKPQSGSTSPSSRRRHGLLICTST